MKKEKMKRKEKRWEVPPHPHPRMFGPNVTYTLGSSLHITEIWTIYSLHNMGRPWQCSAFIVIIKQCGSSQTHNVGPCKAVWYTVPRSLMCVTQQMWVEWSPLNFYLWCWRNIEEFWNSNKAHNIAGSCLDAAGSCQILLKPYANILQTLPSLHIWD